jgi:hypothetical protein
MITAYILVLSVSAWLFGYGVLAVGDRLGRLLGNAALPAGSVALLTALLFLVVVAAPAALICAAFALWLNQWLLSRAFWPAAARIAVPILAGALAASSLPYAAITGVDAPLLYTLAAALLIAVALGAVLLRTMSFAGFALGVIALLLPVALASLLPGMPASLALDAAIIGAALLGAMMGSTSESSPGQAAPSFALLITWLLLALACHMAPTANAPLAASAIPGVSHGS